MRRNYISILINHNKVAWLRDSELTTQMYILKAYYSYSFCDHSKPEMVIWGWAVSINGHLSWRMIYLLAFGDSESPDSGAFLVCNQRNSSGRSSPSIFWELLARLHHFRIIPKIFLSLLNVMNGQWIGSCSVTALGHAGDVTSPTPDRWSDLRQSCAASAYYAHTSMTWPLAAQAYVVRPSSGSSPGLGLGVSEIAPNHLTLPSYAFRKNRFHLINYLIQSAFFLAVKPLIPSLEPSDRQIVVLVGVELCSRWKYTLWRWL